MFNLTKKGVIGFAVAASTLASTAVASPSTVQADLDQPTHTTELSQLVDAYEQIEPFRGIAQHGVDATLELGLVAVDTGDADGGTIEDGYIDLGLNENGVHLIAASDGPTMDRFAIIAHDGDREEFRFPVDLPADAIVRHEETGAIDIISGSETTTLAPATAVDISGDRVPARYRIEDDELVVTVDLANAEFPVMIDPVSATYWWGVQDWYSRSDVRASASWYGVVRIASRACSLMPGWARVACSRTVGAYTNWIYNTWMDAKANNQCLWMKMTWTGQVIGIGRYSCNWG